MPNVEKEYDDGFSPTMQLRLVPLKLKFGEDFPPVLTEYGYEGHREYFRLQQRWLGSEENGTQAEEWRDIPIVEEP